MKKLLQTPSFYLTVAFFIALTSMMGSLYFSEIQKYLPCVLCWYQRICMFPLVVILGVALWRNQKGAEYTALPFSIVGLGIAAYHSYIYWLANFSSQAGSYVSPCSLTGESCTTRYIELFGFVSIPLLSFFAFAGITGCLLISWFLSRQK